MTRSLRPIPRLRPLMQVTFSGTGFEHLGNGTGDHV
jgi:hypothetical protein